MNIKKPIVAIMYDFDKTLCTKNMQEYSFIPNMGLSETEFWDASNTLSKKLQMDGILAYMWQMISESRKNSKSIYRKQLESNPKKVEKELGRVIILLERMLEEQQADLLGRIYISYIRGDISWDKFIELSEVNERMFPVDYGVLGVIAKNATDNTDSIPDEEVYQIQRLQALGLVMERAGNFWGDLVNKYKYERYLITPLGKILIDLNKVPTEGKGVAAEQ